MSLTKSSLLQLLKEKNISPRQSLGQNFMIDPNFLRYIVKTAEVNSGDYILEIGPGPGALTALLTEQAKQIWSVEIDERMYQLVDELLGSRANLEIIKNDILDAGRQKLNPAVEKHLLALKLPRLKVVSNLPYASAIAIIISLLESRLPISWMFLVVQWEIARRLMAQPGSKEYGGYTVLAQTLSEVRPLRKIPPEVFWPKPKVVSSFIEITPKTKGDCPAEAYSRLKDILRILFQHRRKMVGSAYQSFNLTRVEWFDLLARSGISPQQRPEQISRECFIDLGKLYRVV